MRIKLRFIMLANHRFMITLVCMMLSLQSGLSQNRHNVEADIERAVTDFFYKVSEMNNPIEPVRPVNIAAAYQKGINVFQINGYDYKMVDFLTQYIDNTLKDLSISHQVIIKSIEQLTEKNRYKVKGLLRRRIEDDTQRRRVKDESLTLKVIWRGEGYNNVSIQSISFNWDLSFIEPDIIKEYEMSIDPIVSHLSEYGGRWKVKVTSSVKSMEGFDDEERVCVGIEPSYILYDNVDEIDIKEEGESLSGYIGPNKSKDARCFLIVFEQQGSGKRVNHYIYQSGKKKKKNK